MGEHILVVGGVAAGLSAASRARRISAAVQITVLERGPVAAYGACGLPSFLSGELATLDPLVVHPAEFFREQRRIEVLTGHEAVEIEPGRRRVRARTPQGECWFPYDRLILATGATAKWHPRGPDGLSLRNVFAANTWVEAQALDAALRGGERLRRLAVVGAGYIGLEVAQALARRGLQVTLLHPHAAVLRGFDAELASALPPLIAAAGIELRAGVRVQAVERAVGGHPGGRVTGLATSAGAIACDAVVNCGGLRPETALAARAGVALGRWGGIAVDERQQTNLAGIYAAGDCAETRHLVTGAPVWIPLGTAANKQGRVAGQNAAGGVPARFPGVLGTLAVPLFGWEWGRTGLGLEAAHAAGFDAASETVTGGTQAGYLDPRPVTVKIVYERSTGRLLGCHLRGAPGTVTGRLGAAAAALTARLDLEQAEMLDFAYAPALAPLYEPLSIAAHLARARI